MTTRDERGPLSAGRRRMPIGAEWRGIDAGCDVRVWAPKRSRVEMVLEGGHAVALRPEEGGYFRGVVPGVKIGASYRFRLDGGTELYPDPASRFQPDGPHGPSEIVDPDRFAWTDGAWKGVAKSGHVLYELHLGTFTKAGTWDAARAELPELAALGITIVEVMPIADFPGQFGWGYDGVSFFAPSRLYGTPDDARRFVDAAHALGLGVILDVVYNHFGPDGNYLPQFSDTYVTTEHATEWGPTLHFHGPGSEGTRELIVSNAAYWIDEFHFDGLRLDATQNIHDESPDHVLAAVGRAVRAAARGRRTFVVAENEPQDAKLLRRAERGGYGLDAMWNDDFHHTARVALTGHSEAYYMDYTGAPQELLSAIKWGFLFQGQRFAWQKKPRGTPAFDVPPESFVTFLENHDQVSNDARGERLALLASPARHRALIALLLLGPGTPLLFQGEEFGASSPFLFFADHGPELAELVHDGRREFLSQFPSFALREVAAGVAAPHDRATFERCKLDMSERQRHAPIYTLYRDLIALRKKDPTFSRPRPRGVDGAVLSMHAFAARFFGETPELDRLVLVNLGPDLRLTVVPEPLLAPPENGAWTELWASESACYGGTGCPPIERDDGVWHVPAEGTVVLHPRTLP
jgi:maltooligosyltrehalose trehalohydrolase